MGRPGFFNIVHRGRMIPTGIFGVRHLYNKEPGSGRHVLIPRHRAATDRAWVEFGGKSSEWNQAN